MFKTISIIIAIVSTASCVSLADDFPPSFDWRDSGIFTPVKHQLDCGSCGEFAAIALTEALIKKATGNEVDLSEQQIVSCVPGCGCNTGCSSLDALKYIRDHGVALETDFPYLHKDTSCATELDAKYSVTDVRSTAINRLPLKERIRLIKDTILAYGPVATNMALYEDLGRYRNGIYQYDGESPSLGGHWVLIIGWHDNSSLPSGGYWICRNSWGDKWGQKGYFCSAYGDVTGIDDFYIVYAEYGDSSN